MTNMMAMLKKAQEMQKGLKQAQEELAATRYEGAAGGGAVQLTLTGAHELVALRIKPEAIDPADTGMVEDLIRVAHADALGKANAAAQQKMGAITGGLGIPGLGL